MQFSFFLIKEIPQDILVQEWKCNVIHHSYNAIISYLININFYSKINYFIIVTNTANEL